MVINTEKLRGIVDIVMEPIATLLMFGLGIYLIINGKVEAGIALASGATAYWFKNSNQK